MAGATFPSSPAGKLDPEIATTAHGNPAALLVSAFAGYIASALIYDALPPVLPALSQHFGGGERGDLIAQLESTLPILGMAVSGIFSGYLIEHLGVKRVLLGSLLIFAFFGSAGLVIDTAVPMLSTRVLVGFATGTMITCGASLVAANFTGAARARMNGLSIATGAICAIVFVLAAGAVASISWRAPFALHMVLAALLSPAILLMRPAPVAPAEHRETRGLACYLSPLRAAAAPYGLILAVVLIGNLFNIQLTFLLREIGVISSQTIAIVCASYALVVAVSSGVSGRVVVRLGATRTLQLILTLLAVAAGACGGAVSLYGLLAGACLGGVGNGIAIPALISVIMERIEVAYAPRALGVATGMMFIGGSLAPLVYAPVRLVIGLNGVYYVVAALTMACTMLWVLRTPWGSNLAPEAQKARSNAAVEGSAAT